MTTILIKKKDTAGAPAAGDLTNAAGGAEIAVNTATKRIYTKDSGGNVVEVGTNPTATTMNGNLTFVPDATYDIGATGATRPRDIFMSRNLTVGGTMTVAGGINFNGNVTVGDSSADTLTINSTITSNLIFTDNTYDIGASGATRPRNLYLGGLLTMGGALTVNGNATLGDATTDAVTVSGYMGLGGSAANSSIGLNAGPTALTGTNQIGAQFFPTGTSAATASVRGVYARGDTAAASFTCGFSSAFYAADPTKGAGSTITNLYGLYIADQTVGTNNYGLISLVSSGTNKFNIYASGTADNYFAGNVGINTTDTTITGGVVGASSRFVVSGSAGRTQLANTGNEIAFSRNSANYISANGGTSGAIITGAQSYLRFDTGSTLTERMRITSAGYLGVGISGPNSLLQVYGTTNSGYASSNAIVNAATSISNSSSLWVGSSLRLTADMGGAVNYTNRGSELVFGADNGNFGSGGGFSQANLGAITAISENGNAVALASSMLFYTTTGNNIYERMRITSAGDVGIGVTSPSTYANYTTVSIGDTTGGELDFYASGTNVSQIYANATGTTIASIGGRATLFMTNGSERMRINSTGDVIVGSTGTVDSSKFQIFGAKTLSSGIPQQQLNVADTTAIAAGVGGAISFSALYTGAFFTTMGSVEGVRENATDGNYAGALVFKTRTNGSDNNERARIDSSGNFLVGKTANDVTTAGTQLESTGTVAITRASAVCLIVNRNTDDGTLVSLRQANTEEGNISVSGTTVSYNGGHLSRWAQMLTKPELFKGTVMSNLDEMNVYTKDGQPVANEQLNKVKVSDTEGDANVAGVFVNWSHDEEHNVDEINMAMTGDMIIRIAQGVTVVRGDLLMSAGDGTAKPQGDDIVRSKTVAKVTSNHVTCTYADGSYCVPCVLMAC